MSHYRSDRTHSQFLLFDVFGVDRANGVAPHDRGPADVGLCRE